MFQYEGDKYNRITACLCLFKWKLWILQCRNRCDGAQAQCTIFSQLKNWMKGTHWIGRECGVWRERRKLWNYGGQIVCMCVCVCAAFPSARFHSLSLSFSFSWSSIAFLTPFAFRWIWFIHRSITHTICTVYVCFGLGLGDEYNFYSSEHNFVGDGLHSYDNISSGWKRAYTSRWIDIQKKIPQPDIILHSYSAPIDRWVH